MEGKIPFSELLRELAAIIDDKPQGALAFGSRVCQALEQFVNVSPREESVMLLAAAAAAIESARISQSNRRFDSSVTDAGGPIPAVDTGRRRR